MPKDEDLDLDGEGGDDDEDDTPPAPPIPTPQPSPAARKPPKRNKSLGEVPSLPREAELLWPILIDNAVKQGVTAHAMRINVLQIDPPMGQAGDNVSVGSFSGGSVAGTADLPAGMALVQYIADHIHMTRPASRGPVRYGIQFLWAQNSHRIARAELTLPPRDEIIAVRTSEARAAGQAGQMPQMPPLYSPPATPSVAPGMGAPWPSMYPPQNDATPQLLAMMQEMFRATLEGRPPTMPGVAAPPIPATPPISEDAIVNRVTANVLAALEKAGALRPPPGVAAAPAPTPATPPAVVVPTAKSAIEKAFDRVLDTAVQQFTANLEKSVKSAISGVGAPPQQIEEADEPEEAPPKEDPFEVPFKVAAVPETRWPDGSPVNYAADSKTGDISPMGLAMANPFVAGKVVDTANTLVAAITDAIKNIGKTNGVVPTGVARPPLPPPPPQPEIVASTPPGATDATPSDDWKNA
jgi:hypothetical protein